VKVAHALRPDNIAALGKLMGLGSWEVDGKYGLSITLGGREVKLLNLANVYTTVARKGVYIDVSPILSIKDQNGYEVYSGDRDERRPVSEEVAYLIWHILSDEKARLPAFGTRNWMSISGQKVAVKTGTTDEKRDNWTFGFTPSYVVGVWVGNNDNEPMNRYLASGLSGAAPMWNRIMSRVLEGKDREVFDQPDNVFVKVDERCGASEIFIEGSNIPERLCRIEEDEDNNDENSEESD
jgi:membrane peptidoglycan carboxypeptidase